MPNKQDIEILTEEQVNVLTKELSGVLPGGMEAILKKRNIKPEETIRMMSISKTFTRARERTGKNIKSIATELKVPQYRIKDIEKGDVKRIDASFLIRYSHHLGIDGWCKAWVAHNPELSKKLGLFQYFSALTESPIPLPCEQASDTNFRR